MTLVAPIALAKATGAVLAYLGVAGTAPGVNRPLLCPVGQMKMTLAPQQKDPSANENDPRANDI